ncbi:hydrolase [Streptomyces agglomeratus]|uniref:HAD family acid phosphatase n=1 Tax=Streptomyces agglomeratus TaxID=285458 RepID=UPI000852864E|nr:HAD family acid phosphatase [Streptomyces agglomeratus]OEJ37369.1 hydrolase [Streptomyces agglomeratus]OEJ48248.1 hydrolase [Streptomyces agglomeratus]OEJ57238.1 hydrolase [Streptomyces agglomeratus]
MRVRRWRTRAAASLSAAALTAATVVASATASAASAPAQEAAVLSPAAAAPSQHLDTAARWSDVDYATWQRDVAAVVAKARPYIEQRTSAPSSENHALVLDIDNTSLETEFHDFWKYPTPAVKPILDLSRFADSRDVDVFFVTARPGIIESLTEYNLRKVGYPVSGVHTRSLPDLFEEVSAYKTDMRSDIEDDGYTIIANIGNRDSDLVGGHAERTFKLPDYGGQLS